MKISFQSRWCVVWSCILAVVTLIRAEKPVAGRRSRQAQEEEGLEGVWSPWGEWTECSQSCGLGVSERRRKCLPPPPTPPHTWAGPSYLLPGIPSHTPVISAVRPYHPSHYPGSEPPQYGGGGGGERPPFYPPPPRVANEIPGLPLYRNEPGGSGPEPSNQAPPFYRPEFPASSHNPVSIYRSPPLPSSPASSSLPYGQSGRVFRRPPNQGVGRAAGGGSRRSVSASRDPSHARRSGSSIRPGQFGYGRVPFSLPLHRTNRHARHTRRHGNATVATPDTKVGGHDPSLRGSEDRAEAEVEKRGEEEREGANKQEVGGNGRTKEGARGGQERMEREDTKYATESGSPVTEERNGGAERERDRTRERALHHGGATQRHGPAHAGRGRHVERRAPPPVASHPYPSPPFHTPYALPASGPQSQPHPPPPNPNIWPLQGGPHPHRPQPLPADRGADRGPDRGAWSRPQPSQNYRCSGRDREYRRCFAQSCPGPAVEPRAEQCASFNSQEFMGRIYDWEPFTEVGLDQQCELTCRPVGYRFYVRQAERVRDGTPCVNNSPNDVCVAGRCLTEGCDGVLGSGLVRDRCGVCGGQEGSCQRVSGSFQNSSVPLGYHHILDIPPGATAINITERHASPNYLALRSGTGQSVVNGRWAVDPPGQYQAGGTTFQYSRPREEKGESLTAPGPTSTLLQLYIIFHRQNPGIDYEYYVPVERSREGEREMKVEREGGRASLREIGALTVSVEDPIPAPPVSSSSSSPPFSFPSSSSSLSSSSSSAATSDRWSPERSRPRGSGPNRNARIPPRTDLPLDNQSPFVWRRGGLTECTATCGKGSQYRVIVCVNRHTEQEVPERKCDSASKPALEEEPCNTHPCPPFWEVGSWSECSVSCGWGVQQRQVQCRQSFGNRSTMVLPQRCSGLSRPNSTQPCHAHVCSHWEISSNWSSCSVDCGVGKRTRNVRCVSDNGNIVSDRECNSRLRPQGSEDCHMGPCVTNWYFTNWSDTCSATCGPGVQRREVVCLTRGGSREGGGAGDCVGEKPADMKACNGGPCKAVTQWYAGPWGQCSAACGNGTQRRDVICVEKLGSDFRVTGSSECAHLDKPSPVQTCELEECRPQWFSTEWSACSRSCGKGLQAREVRCLTVDKQHSQACDPNTKPEKEQLCNTLPCSPFADENCRDRRQNCMMVVQARLCVYAYYKTACCASCTQSAQRSKRH